MGGGVVIRPKRRWRKGEMARTIVLYCLRVLTLVLTGVFAYMAVMGKISQDFMTIYAVIIAFYFGTQSQKTQDAMDRGAGDGQN